ncbi:MAG TPA: DUF1080 domain-containing protein [Vicinamibacterales bacterium]
MNRREWLRHAAALAGSLAAGIRTHARQDAAWTPLFDGVSLDGWEQTSFGGEGPVTVRDGMIVLGFGDSLTGITWTRDVPRMNFEIALEAVRLSGNDFFCGLTFPVADSYCSFIVGGWGGTTVGLSSLDGMDASENETTREIRFEDGRWYGIRVAVRPHDIRAWLDEEEVVNVATAGRRIDIRPEVEPSIPLGIASYRTRAGLRSIRMRTIAGVEGGA